MYHSEVEFRACVDTPGDPGSMLEEASVPSNSPVPVLINYSWVIFQPWMEWRNHSAFLACQVYLQPGPPARSCQQQGQLAHAGPLPCFVKVVLS